MSKSFAFLFPGQGSQRPGMLEAFIGSEPVVDETLAEASEALGYDMAALFADRPEGRLNRTEYTQPALLAASTALARLWRQRGGPEAACGAGHSLGEYSALVAAGSLDFAEALRLVAFRGRAMNEAVAEGEGRMAAILGLEDARIEELCEEASTQSERVWPANYNCPGQLVVAGHAAAVDRLMEAARAAGAKRALPLPVSAPSHTPLMQPAADAMAERLKKVEIRAPMMPVWSNALAAPLDEPDEIREALVRQLVSPVRWSEIVRHMARTGVLQGVEMGPGKVLAGIVRRIDRCFSVHVSETPEALTQALEHLQ